MSVGGVITLGFGNGFSNASYLVTLGFGPYLTGAHNTNQPAGVGRSGRKKRWQAEYKDSVYEFDNAEEARQFLISLQQTYKQTRTEKRRRNAAAIITPRVDFTVDAVPVSQMVFDGMDALRAIYVSDRKRLAMLEAAVNRQIAERDDEEALLWLS